MNEIKDLTHLYNALGGYKSKLEHITEDIRQERAFNKCERGMYERLFARNLEVARDYPIDIEVFEDWWQEYRRNKVIVKGK